MEVDYILAGVECIIAHAERDDRAERKKAECMKELCGRAEAVQT